MHGWGDAPAEYKVKSDSQSRKRQSQVSRGVILVNGPSKAFSFAVAAAAFVSAAWATSPQTRAPAKAATPAKAAAPAPEAPPDKSLGSRSAPIVMEVFSDYSCPVCKTFYINAVRPLLDDYIAAGKVYLIHRDFPLKGVIGHEHSREAAEYVNAAARIGRFQEVDAALYDKQEVWVRNGSVEAVVAAVLSPRDLKRVKELVESGKLDTYIDSDYALGNSKGVRSTPTIYITANGKTDLVPGNVSYSLLKRYLDEQLQRR
jgi:protein-disulfide isomerase